MSRDLNPNRAGKDEVDDVFIATAGEVMYRRGRARKDRQQIREVNLKKAQEIVDKANQDKKKGKK